GGHGRTRGLAARAGYEHLLPRDPLANYRNYAIGLIVIQLRSLSVRTQDDETVERCSHPTVDVVAKTPLIEGFVEERGNDGREDPREPAHGLIVNGGPARESL